MRLIAPARARTAIPNRGRWVVVPESYDRLATASFRRGQRRRLQIFIVLVAAACGSGILALLAGGGMWEVQVAFDASLGLYVALLLEAKHRREERDVKVHSLAARRPRPMAPDVEEAARALGGPR